jgi:RING-type zinc-finger
MNDFFRVQHARAAFVEMVIRQLQNRNLATGQLMEHELDQAAQPLTSTPPTATEATQETANQDLASVDDSLAEIFRQANAITWDGPSIFSSLREALREEVGDDPMSLPMPTRGLFPAMFILRDTEHTEHTQTDNRAPRFKIDNLDDDEKKTPFGRLHARVTCAVCWDLLDDPRLLPCGHCFCRECIRLQMYNDCPMCRARYNRNDVLQNSTITLFIRESIQEYIEWENEILEN